MRLRVKVMQLVTRCKHPWYGLSAYVCGSDPEKLKGVARQIRAGQVHVNYGSKGTNAPFGGFKQSGNGREKAEWGLEEFLETKAIME